MASKKRTKKMSRVSELELNKKIKELKESRVKAEVKADTVLDFDAWYSLRKRQIPSNHRKEILVVYMKSIGLSTKETKEKFDSALEKYGVKLK